MRLSTRRLKIAMLSELALTCKCDHCINTILKPKVHEYLRLLIVLREQSSIDQNTWCELTTAVSEVLDDGC